jgi:hypothetical protein
MAAILTTGMQEFSKQVRAIFENFKRQSQSTEADILVLRDRKRAEFMARDMANHGCCGLQNRRTHFCRDRPHPSVIATQPHGMEAEPGLNLVLRWCAKEF